MRCDRKAGARDRPPVSRRRGRAYARSTRRASSPPGARGAPRGRRDPERSGHRQRTCDGRERPQRGGQDGRAEDDGARDAHDARRTARGVYERHDRTVRRRALTDVGDDQSLSKSLSTFSAHVQNLAHILDETRPGPSSSFSTSSPAGTDPRLKVRRSARRVCSILSVRARRRSRGDDALRAELKALGARRRSLRQRERRLRSRDDDTHVPPRDRRTRELERPRCRDSVRNAENGDRTRRAVPLAREDQNFESLVKKLNAERAALELARHAADDREREAARDGDGSRKARIAEAKSREKQIVSREAEALLGSLRRAKEDLRAAWAKLRTKKIDESALRDAARAIDRVAGQAARLGGRARERDDARGRDDARRRPAGGAPARSAGVCAKTASRSGGARSSFARSHPRGGGSHEAVGGGRGAPQRRARGERASPRGREGAHRGARERALTLEVPIQTSDNTCDVRGLRADDAVAMATSFLDRSLNEGRQVAFVIHGHGTGALREAIRRELRASAYVAQFRAGESGEGGDGVTVVWLA